MGIVNNFDTFSMIKAIPELYIQLYWQGFWEDCVDRPHSHVHTILYVDNERKASYLCVVQMQVQCKLHAIVLLIEDNSDKSNASNGKSFGHQCVTLSPISFKRSENVIFNLIIRQLFYGWVLNTLAN